MGVTNMKSESVYQELLSGDPDESPSNQGADNIHIEDHAPLRPRSPSLILLAWRTGIILPVLLNVVFVTLGVSLYRQRGPGNPLFPQALYSPAQDVLSYKVQKFHSGFENDRTIYQGSPTEESDQAWEDLYIFGRSHVSKTQAALLPNKTIAADSDGSGGYLVGIAVFHQLHCLNMIRKALYFFYDKEWNAENNSFNTPLESLDENHAEFGQLGLRHLDHCIDSLRQSLQCSSDISPYVWQWSEEDGAVMGYADIVHTCRDFDAIRDWARERQYSQHLETSTRRDEQGKCGFADMVDCSSL